MQDYTPLDATRYVKDILPDMQSTIESAISNFSGTAFPAKNLFVGMKCYRTDEKAEYTCTAVDTDGTGTWEQISGGQSLFDIDTDGGIMPAETVAWDKNFETDDNNDIQPKEE